MKTSIFAVAAICVAVTPWAQTPAPGTPAASIVAPDVIFIEPFSKDPGLADTDRKQERIEEIPESRLIQLQETIQTELAKIGLFKEVRLLKIGETPVLAEGQEAWVFGGKFLDYKKGSQAARYWIGMGAGKQKVEVLAHARDARTGAVVKEERIVDRKVGGFFGGNDEKGLRDFAERVVVFLREAKMPGSTKSAP